MFMERLATNLKLPNYVNTKILKLLLSICNIKILNSSKMQCIINQINKK